MSLQEILSGETFTAVTYVRLLLGVCLSEQRLIITHEAKHERLLVCLCMCSSRANCREQIAHSNFCNAASLSMIIARGRMVQNEGRNFGGDLEKIWRKP